MSSLFPHWSDSALNLFQIMFGRLPQESENVGVILMMDITLDMEKVQPETLNSF